MKADSFKPYPAGGYGSGWYFVRATKFACVVAVVWLVVETALFVVQLLNSIVIP